MDTARPGSGWISRLALAAGGGADDRTVRSLLIAALVAVAVDCAVFALVTAGGLRLEAANALSFAAALVAGGAAFAHAFGRGTAGEGRALARFRPGGALVVAALAFAMHAGVLSLLVRTGGFSPTLAIVPAAVAGSVVLLAGARFMLLARRMNRRTLAPAGPARAC